MDRFPQNRAQLFVYLFQHLGIVASAGSYIDPSRSATWFSRSVFGLWSLQRLSTQGSRWGYVIGFASSMTAGMSCVQGIWLWHCSSCWDAKPQYHQKVIKKLGSIPWKTVYRNETR
ncbi:hypothetical protein BDM02DRAFT_3120323 [Thelephora ganbajun]|uniref:Uncharacterized protein n=1 Tax=Thelephora ganbajun TaxID=370292 RepID=A0ACB6Z6R7_THEGA|nr:hypothetical protein BDM02DRAFT_3120323 [Thelephora ganbajun]